MSGRAAAGDDRESGRPAAKAVISDVHATLIEAEITDPIDKQTSSDDAEHSKPHSDTFEAARRNRLGEAVGAAYVAPIGRVCAWI